MKYEARVNPTDAVHHYLRAEKAEAEVARLRGAMHRCIALTQSRDPIVMHPSQVVNLLRIAIAEIADALRSTSDQSDKP